MGVWCIIQVGLGWRPFQAWLLWCRRGVKVCLGRRTLHTLDDRSKSTILGPPCRSVAFNRIHFLELGHMSGAEAAGLALWLCELPFLNVIGSFCFSLGDELGFDLGR